MADIKQIVAKARALAGRGEIKQAVSLLLQAGAIEEAVRILVKNHRFDQAAVVLLDAVGVPAKEYVDLDTLKTRYVSLAASLYAKTKKHKEAVELLLALGQKSKAADVLEKVGENAAAAKLRGEIQGEPVNDGPKKPSVFGNTDVTIDIAERLEKNKKYQLALEAYMQLKRRKDAGRMAEKLGDTKQAAQLYGDAGMHFEAAVCFMKLRDKEQCLSNLLRVSKDHPKYRAACHNVIRLAENLDQIDFQTEYLLTEFVQSGAKSAKELPFFFALAKLYKKHDLVDNAAEVVEAVIARDPKFSGAKKLQKEIKSQQKASLEEYARVVEEDDSFQTAAKKKKPKKDILPGLPDLPDLPDLPSLPSLPPMPAPAGAATAAAPHNAAALATVATQRDFNAPGEAVQQPASTRHEDIFVPGGIIDDRYRIGKKIGQGGMAMVFKADDMELDETVALKVFIRPIDDDETLERFKQELRLSRKLSHPNVIRLHDIGIYLGHRYLSMEFLQGKDLQDFMGRPMDLKTGLDLLVQVCDGLEVAHKEGVIHRDMKPPNVFVTTNNVAKVMDFGIAKNQAADGLTQAGLIFGTPQYMSPEQINDPRKVGPGTDLYAMGIMAYQMFTGTLPFSHPELVTLLMMQANQPAEPPRMRNEDIPKELEVLIMKLMNKQPEDRHQSCAELSSELRKLQKQLIA